ncbi:hypothetical protein N7492_005802 [Penicillium capsulatum]|uniref:C2H2-type domain-containing protein n=1 Tax=Penicillium capsulatum TaxID=69766 RepID=A0A9W9IC48_9EURO|nr:hypothetical protein N7492_005802 [Penicillium capsulatum]KAJ6135098.1 hypothetical protein N7512_000258 [Penicillium capsulatum]
MEHLRTVTDPKVWTCDGCLATFGRIDHLKRHALTHHSEKTHSCHFCGASFGRGDVLRRHWKSCKTRREIGQEIPDSLRGGKHKRACDSCAVIRKACSGETPCSECNHRQRPCTYRRLTEGDDSSNQQFTNSTSNAEDNGYDVDIDVPEDGWDLGHQTFYPSRETSLVVYARNNYGTET